MQQLFSSIRYKGGQNKSIALSTFCLEIFTTKSWFLKCLSVLHIISGSCFVNFLLLYNMCSLPSNLPSWFPYYLSINNTFRPCQSLHANKTNTTCFAMAVPTFDNNLCFGYLLHCNKPPLNLVSFKRNQFYYCLWFKSWLMLRWMVLLLSSLLSVLWLQSESDSAEILISKMVLFMWLVLQQG